MSCSPRWPFNSLDARAEESCTALSWDQFDSPHAMLLNEEKSCSGGVSSSEELMCFMPQMLKRRLGTREVHNCFYGQSNCCSLQLRCSLMIRCRTIKGSFGAYFQNRLINLLEANLWERESFLHCYSEACLSVSRSEEEK